MLEPAPSASKNGPRRTVKQVLHDIWKSSKRKPQELIDHSRKPPHFEYIWRWYMDFPPPVTWSEIRSWSEFSGIKPTRWEAEMLIRIDNLRK